MAFKALLYLVAAFLAVTSKASYGDGEVKEKAIEIKDLEPTLVIPEKPSTPTPPVNKPPTPAPPVYKPPTPAPPVYKPPTPAPPDYKPPTPAPPVYKPPTPAPPVYKPPTPAPPLKPPTPTLPPVRTRKDCIPLCGERCKLHSRKNVCVRACMTCCDRCKCVPPGTYGNKEKCGKCYTGMTTHHNKPKCP